MLVVNLCFGFSLSAEKSPDNPMLGRREVVDGKVRNQHLVIQLLIRIVISNNSCFVLTGWEICMANLQRSI